MPGEIGILNVGAGDTKLIFDKTNLAELLRAKRIVTDMLKRGYALLVETGEKDDAGRPVTRRVKAFDENTCEYIIADFDPLQAAEHDAHEQSSQETSTAPGAPAGEPGSGGRGGKGPRVRGGGERRIDASKTRGVAIARTAGG